MRLILLSLFLSISYTVMAADVACRSAVVVNSVVSIIECGEVQGTIKSDTPIKKVKVVVGRRVENSSPVSYTNTEYEVVSSKLTASNLYPLDRNDEVLAAIKLQDEKMEKDKAPRSLLLGDTIIASPDGIYLDDSTKIYENDKELGTIAEVSKKIIDSKPVICDYLKTMHNGVELPFISIIDAPLHCTGKKLCSGYASCLIKGETKTQVISCPADGDLCPDASTCYADKKVVVGKLEKN
jgi:hypothetical protein